MDRPDAVGHFRRRCGVSSSAQGRHAGAPGRGAPRSGAGGQPVDQSEDIVQDILLAVHLKRHTWDADAPFAPWLFAIARNKLIDSLRRRGRRIFVNIDDFAETLPSEPAAETAPASEVAAQLQVAAGASARGFAVDRGRQRVDQGYRDEIRDERGRGARGAASRACQPHRQTAGDNDDGNRSAHSNARRRQRAPRAAGRVRAGDGVAGRGAGFSGDVLRRARRSAGCHDRDAQSVLRSEVSW